MRYRTWNELRGCIDASAWAATGEEVTTKLRAMDARASRRFIPQDREAEPTLRLGTALDLRRYDELASSVKVKGYKRGHYDGSARIFARLAMNCYQSSSPNP